MTVLRGCRRLARRRRRHEGDRARPLRRTRRAAPRRRRAADARRGGRRDPRARLLGQQRRPAASCGPIRRSRGSRSGCARRSTACSAGTSRAVVASVGAKVTRLRPGDRVFCEADDGAYAEFVRVPEELRRRRSPRRCSFEQAATLPLAGGTALQAVRAAGPIGPGSTVLMTGASGNVGLFAVQFAAASGAEVTAVCSGAKAELVRARRCHHVIDYRARTSPRSDARYDVVIDIAGDRPWSRLRAGARAAGHARAVVGRRRAGARAACRTSRGRSSPRRSCRSGSTSLAAVRRREDLERDRRDGRGRRDHARHRPRVPARARCPRRSAGSRRARRAASSSSPCEGGERADQPSSTAP